MKKRKGPAQQVPLSERMKAQRAAELRAVRMQAVEQAVDLVYLADAIAENETGGWGDKRIRRRQARSQELMADIRELAISDGFEYAHSVLQRRYHQTVKQVQEEEI